MSDSIRLHPKHGLNPTMPVCIWCGQDTGEIVLLGAAYEGEAPHRMVMNAEPCDSCREAWEGGVMLALASNTKSSEFPLEIAKDAGAFVSGTHWVITHEAAKRILNIEGDKALIDREAAIKLGLMTESGEVISHA